MAEGGEGDEGLLGLETVAGSTGGGGDGATDVAADFWGLVAGGGWGGVEANGEEAEGDECGDCFESFHGSRHW